MATVTTPDLLLHLIDDAAIFPPGNLPLDRAVAEHREHLTSEYAGLLGGFVVSDVRIPDLIEVVGDSSTPLAINVVVTGGAGAIQGAVRWARRAEQLDLQVLEFALRDEDDLAHNAQRLIAAIDDVEDELDDAVVYVEPPRLHGEPQHGWLAALDVLASREIPLKFRTGGVDPDDVPTAAELAACIDAALDRELGFKCTAGLHHAVAAPGQHGFLNVLAATRATLDGGDAASVLAETDPAHLLPLLDAGARRWFHSVGSCSILEPHEDLVELGLL